MDLSKDNKRYLVIIGDIKKSKQLEKRYEIQKRLKKCLDKINSEYKESIVSTFVITLGDEFQGVLTTMETAVFIIDMIEREMYPVKFRFGLGVGEITTDINPIALGADGPAYYCAREMINQVKTSENRKGASRKNIMIKIVGDESLSSMLNTIFLLVYAIKRKWTPQQWKIINIYQEQGGTQTGVAKKLGIAQSSVQRALSASDYYAYLETLQTLDTIHKKIPHNLLHMRL